MFKEAYKKEYDNIHPSPELIERTKQLAIEACLNPSLEEENETDQWNVEEFDGKAIKKRKWVRFAGGMAAGLAIVATGAYIGMSLQPKHETPAQYSSVERTPELETFVEETSEAAVKDKLDKKPSTVDKRESIVGKVASNKMASYAKQSKATGIRLDYASSSKVIFHSDFGIMIYNMASKAIDACIPASEYVESKDYNTQTVLVNADGTKVLWYYTETGTEKVKVYTLATAVMEVISGNDLQWEEELFSGVISIATAGTDIYCSGSAVENCVSIGNGSYCQLMYQAPTSRYKASLAVAVVNPGEKKDQIYSVFGEIGKAIVKDEGCAYGDYYNELGLGWKGDTSNNTEPGDLTTSDGTASEVEPAEAVETEEPKETSAPEATVEPTKESQEEVVP